MGLTTQIFFAFALVSVLNCAPVDDSTAKPALTTSLSSAAPVSGSTQQSTDAKQQTAVTKHDSDESKDSSDSSSEEHTKRPKRDTENSAVIMHQTKDATATAAQTPATSTTDVPKPSAPTRQTRDTDIEHRPALLLALNNPDDSQLSTSPAPSASPSASTSATPSTTAAASTKDTTKSS